MLLNVREILYVNLWVTKTQCLVISHNFYFCRQQEINRNRDVRGDDGAPPLPPKSPKRLDGSLPPPLPARNYQVGYKVHW